MEELTEQKCVACRVGAPSVTPEETKELQPQVPEWQIVTEDGFRNWIACSSSKTSKTLFHLRTRSAQRRKKKVIIRG